ncbi:MAG: hypothetical protein AAB288_04825 [Acidobacteriota bacterium]
MTEHEYIVTDSRYHQDPDNAEVYFGSSEVEEAITVANEVGYNFLVIRHVDGQIIHDAALHTELPLQG